MTYDPIEQARLIYEAQPTAYNASAYQVAMQLAALKVEIEQNLKAAKEDRKAAKAELTEATLLADKYRWHPIDTAPMENRNILVCYELDGERWVGNGYYEQGLWNKGEYVGWVCEGIEGDCVPTHWMHLPQAPEIPEGPIND